MLDSNGRFRKTGASASRNIESEMDYGLSYHPQGHPPELRQSPDRIAVRQNRRVLFVTLDEIDWIEACDNYVSLHCDGKTHLLRETMSEVETRLASARFVRIHRSAIVNIERIKELQPWFRGDYRVILHDGTKLTLTKNHRGNLDALLLLGFFNR
jgi:two-component system LytT family response regulator